MSILFKYVNVTKFLCTTQRIERAACIPYTFFILLIHVHIRTYSLKEKTEELKECTEEFESKQKVLTNQVEKLKNEIEGYVAIAIHMNAYVHTYVHVHMVGVKKKHFVIKLQNTHETKNGTTQNTDYITHNYISCYAKLQRNYICAKVLHT